MRILLVLHQFYPEFVGGTERVALNLALAAQRAGHYVHVLACQVDPTKSLGEDCQNLEHAKDFTYQGVPVTLLAKSQLPVLADFSLDCEPTLVEPLTKWITFKQFDVCHVLHTMRTPTFILAAQRCRLPIILTLTDFFLPCFRINLVTLGNQLCDGPQKGERCCQDCLTAPWDRKALAVRYDNALNILACASVRVAPSEFVANRFRKAFPELDFIVIGHGLNVLELLKRREISSEMTRQSRLRLGYVGAIIPQKGLAILLRALAQVDSPDIELLVMGGFSGAAAYGDEVQKLGNADPRVRFFGHLDRSELFTTVSNLDLLCLPSLVPETFSLALHEACALGVPALVSNVGAPSEWVEKNGVGATIPVGDVSAWSQTIDRLVHHPEQIRQWRANLPLPARIEEEAFFYESIYWKIVQ